MASLEERWEELGEVAQAVEAVASNYDIKEVSPFLGEQITAAIVDRRRLRKEGFSKGDAEGLVDYGVRYRLFLIDVAAYPEQPSKKILEEVPDLLHGIK